MVENNNGAVGTTAVVTKMEMDFPFIKVSKVDRVH
jgi:hypothetical protein